MVGIYGSQSSAGGRTGVYSSAYGAPKRKKKKQDSGGGFLDDVTGSISDAISGVDDAFGVGNLAKMGWNFLPGIYNIGKGLVTDPNTTANNLAKAVGGSFLSTADTLTLGLADKQLEGLADSADLHVPGQEISPFWEREQGILPGLVEDVLNVATVAAPVAGAAKAGQASALARAVKAAELGDAGAQATALADAARLGGTLAKAEKVAHPFRTIWRAGVRGPAAKAVEAKMAAAGASRTVEDAAAATPDVPETGPPAGAERRAAERPTPGEGERYVMRDEAGNEINTVGDLGQDAEMAQRVYDAETGRRPGSVLNIEGPDGVVFQGKAREAGTPNVSTAEPDVSVLEAAQGGTPNPDIQAVVKIDGRPFMRTPDVGEARKVAADAERSGAKVEVVFEGEGLGKLDIEGTPATAATSPLDDLEASAEATATEAAMSKTDVGPATATQDPADTAAQAAENVVEQTKQRNAIQKFLVGSKTPGESTLPLRTRVLAGVGERLIAADLRLEMKLQQRYAQAAKAIALQSEPVKASVAVAKDFLRDVLPEASPGELSRIVGDEITARMNTIRQVQDAYGIPDEVAVQLGWRNEVLPKELVGNPERMGEFNQAIDAATELWREGRKGALEDLRTGRLGEKGLEGVGSDAPVLTKTEQKMLRDIQKDLKRAQEMSGAVERETLRAERRVAGLDDLEGNLTSKLARTGELKQGVVAAFDRARSGLPSIWKDAKNAGRWQGRLAELFDMLMDESADFRGWTYDPHADAFVTAPSGKGRYVVGLLPGDEGIPVSQLTPDTIEQVARYYQELFDGRNDIMLGAWEYEGRVYIEPSQIVKSRSEAVNLGQSRAQTAIWDLGAGDEIATNFGRPDVHGQFSGSRRTANGKVSSNHHFRDRFATGLYEAAESTRGITPEGVDAAMALDDHLAVSWGKATGKHPDLYFAEKNARFRQRKPSTLSGRLFQTILPHRDPKAELWKQAEQAGVDIETARKWYFRSHDAIESKFRGKEITLLNGHRMDAADLVYELLAVSSVSAAPLDNLASALTGVANMKEFNATYGKNLTEVQRLVEEFQKLGPGRVESPSGRGPALRTQSELFEALAKNTHQVYTGPQYHAFEILSGHTINPYDGWGGWTTEYLRNQPEQFGGATKALPDAKITDADIAHYMDEFGVDAERARDLAVREYHGSSALAKILSFHDNLSRPAESMAVTLDSWMSRLFGDADWMSKGTYRTYADTMRQIARDLSESMGETVKPHEVQAVFWAYAKEEVSRQNVGMLHAHAAEALDMLEAGTWTPENDPLITWMELDTEPLQAAETAKQPGRDLYAARQRARARGAKKGLTDKELKAYVAADKKVIAAKEAAAGAPPSRVIHERDVPVVRGADDAQAARSAEYPLQQTKELEEAFYVETEAFNDAVLPETPSAQVYATSGDQATRHAALERVVEEAADPEYQAKLAAVLDEMSPDTDEILVFRGEGNSAPGEYANVAMVSDYARKFQGKGEPEAYLVPKDAVVAVGSGRETELIVKTEALGQPLQRPTGPTRGTERNLHVSDAKNADVVKEKLGTPERYRNTVQEDVREALRNGDSQEASKIVSSWVNRKASNIRDESWGDFFEMLNGNAGGERLPAALERLRDGFLDETNSVERLGQQMGDEVLGSTVLRRTPEQRITIDLYRNADFTTLVHENAHYLRQMLPEADLRQLGAAYGIKYSKGNWTWTRQAEERFANDFTGYLASGRSGVQGMGKLFERMRTELLQRWFYVTDSLTSNRMGQAIPPGTRDILHRYLNPDVSELSATPGFELNSPGRPAAFNVSETGVVDVGARLLAKEAQTTPNAPGASQAAMYRSGVTSGRAIEKYAKLGEREAQIQKQIETVRRTRDQVKTAILEGTLPKRQAQAELTGRASKTYARVIESADNPSLSRVPAQWQPLYKAVEDVLELTKDNPEAAAQFADFPKTFSEMIRLAEERGWDPVHVRSFTPADVHRLVYQTMKLGKGGEKLGNELAAGTRFVRNYKGSRHTSIEALVSSALEVTHEARTNGVVDMIENRVARTLAPGEDLPEGWVFWAPRKNSIRMDVDVQTGDLTAANPDGGAIIPKAADDVLRRYTQDHSHAVFKAIGKVTNPWRALVLTLAPRWYVNNIFGNIMLATAEGVRLQDWVKAWNAFKKDSQGYRFNEVPQVTRSSQFSELAGEQSIVPGETGLAGFKEAKEAGGILGAAKHGQARLARANEVVDEMSRAAVYFKTIRKGGSPEHALNRAMEAMVDYHSLSPFEQQVVRSVVPFYSWQRGMLKMGLSLPVDHPLAANISFWLDRFNKTTQEEEFGTLLPPAYQNVVKVPGLGAINLRAANPLADSDALLTPQGIARSMNPFLKIGVRAGLNAPEYGEEKVGIGQTGAAESQVNIRQAVANVGSTLPQAQVAGLAPYPSYGTGADVGKFFGVPAVTPAQLKKIIERTKEGRATVAGPDPSTFRIVSSGRKKKKKRTSGLFTSNGNGGLTVR